MTVDEILKTKGSAVYSISPDLTVIQACDELDRRHIGALVVCDGNNIVGVFSERDMVRAIALDGASALDRPASDYMTARVIFGEHRETITALMARMSDRRIRHLPILKNGVLSGVVSIGDIVKAQIAEQAQEVESLRTYITAS